MSTVNMLQAKSSLSRLVELIEQEQEREIIIARNVRPAAKLVTISHCSNCQRLGVAKDIFVAPDSIDTYDDEAMKLFTDGEF